HGHRGQGRRPARPGRADRHRAGPRRRRSHPRRGRGPGPARRRHRDGVRQVDVDDAPAVKRAALAAALFAAVAVALGFLALPVVAIFARVPPRELVDQLSNPVVTDAIRVSFETSLVAQALILAFATPTAFVLASRRFRGRSLLVTAAELPLVLPPAVAGIGLFAAFGRIGLLGSTLSAFGIEV